MDLFILHSSSQNISSKWDKFIWFINIENEGIY